MLLLDLRLLQSLTLRKNTITTITTTNNHHPSRCCRQRFSSPRHRSALSPLLVAAIGILRSCLEFPTHDERTSRALVLSRCDPRRNPERGCLRGCTLRRSLLQNHRLVDHHLLLFSATSVGRRDLSVYLLTTPSYLLLQPRPQIQGRVIAVVTRARRIGIGWIQRRILMLLRMRFR